MSVFSKVMASVGIGSAKVDTRLDSDTVRVGGPIQGVIHIQGGSAEQDIDSIYLHLMTEYVREYDDSKSWKHAAVAKWRISEPIRVQPGEEWEVPFSFEVPLNTPTTAGHVKVWLQTGLDIDYALDPGDTDRLKVLPHPHMKAVLDAVKDMGFRFKESTCEYSSRLGRGVPFIQEHEFFPSFQLKDLIKELELVFFVNPDSVEVLVEVDRRTRGFTGLLESALDLDERKQLVHFTEEDLELGPRHLAAELTAVIERHAW